MNSKIVLPFLSGLTLITLASVSYAKKETASAPQVHKAVAVMVPTQGNQTSGVLTFSESDQGVRIRGVIKGLVADKEHGFHIHEFGDCSSPDATSAGGHLNFAGKPHGAPDAAEHHAGDMGNIKVNSKGEAEVDLTFQQMKLNGPESVVGHGVIIHAAADDYKTQPTGNAGARVACGVIGVAKP